MKRLNELLSGNETLRRIVADYGGQIRKILIVALLIVICLFVFALKNGNDDIEITQADEQVSDEVTEQSGETLFVDIGGAVAEPMLAELPEGSRVEDAIKAAGGLTENADMSSINRAAFVNDGDKIYIPEIILDEDGNPVSTAVSASGGNGLVNINTADSETLQTLSGVGPATARKIIDYRDSNGRFEKIEDLKNVSGIGEKTFEKLKDSITV